MLHPDSYDTNETIEQTAKLIAALRAELAGHHEQTLTLPLPIGRYNTVLHSTLIKE